MNDAANAPSNLRERCLQPLIILAATFLFGSTFPAGKWLLQHHTPPLFLAAVRFLLAPLSLLAAAYVSGQARLMLRPSVRMGEAMVIAVIGVLQTGVCIGCLFLAMQRISPPAAALLLFTNPIWVAALGIVVLQQPLTANRVLGLALGISGVALILNPGARGFDPLGYMFGLLSSFGWAGATLVTKKANLTVSPWTLTFWQMIVGAIALLGLSLLIGENWHEALRDKSDIIVLVWLAVPASACAYGLWSVALRRSKNASEVSSFLFLVPFFAAILSYCVLGSTLSFAQLLGGAAICCGLWISSHPFPRTTPSMLAAR